MQQGGSPTPFDRNMGTKMAAKCVDWMVTTLKENTGKDGKVCCTADNTAVLLGIIRRQYKFTPLCELTEQTNFE